MCAGVSMLESDIKQESCVLLLREVGVCVDVLQSVIRQRRRFLNCDANLGTFEWLSIRSSLEFPEASGRHLTLKSSAELLGV